MAAAAAEQGKPNKKQKGIETTLKDLAEEKNSGVGMLLTISVEKGTTNVRSEQAAYFIKDESVIFRHEGKREASPDRVYLCVENNTGDEWVHSAALCFEKVSVYYSASGTGKTVELAVTSVTRNVDVTLLPKISNSDEAAVVRAMQGAMKKEEGGDADENPQAASDEEKIKTARDDAASACLRSALQRLFNSHAKSFQRIFRDAPDDGLKVAIALDEGSIYPTIVRSIIGNRKRASVVSALFFENFAACPKKILFSIAGTGVASSTVGSNTEDFLHREPSAISDPLLYPRMSLQQELLQLTFPGEAQLQPVSIQTIKEKLPIMHCMLANARMASIALKKLYQFNNETENIKEGKILDEVCLLFITSNGLNRLLSNARAKATVAACSLAIHLFQCTFDDGLVFQSDDDLDEFMYKYGCGFEFDAKIAPLIGGRCSEHARSLLLSKYALLEPNPEQSPAAGVPIHKPFLMRPAQQLIALHLLGIKLSNLVSADPFGFEILSTHTMKAALAASSVVALGDRKSVKETLELVGCQVKPKGGGTSTAARQKFLELGDCVVVRHQYRDTYDDDEPTQARTDIETATPTMLLPSEMVLVGSVSAVSVCGAYEAKLRSAKAQPNADIFFLPLTAINYGNSSLADGFITFFMANRSEPGKTLKFSCMNQAKDKLGYDGSPIGCLPMASIAANATRCNNSALDFLFGGGKYGDRLLFVSAPTGGAGLFAKDETRISIERNWIPRVMDDCKVLRSLMTTLARQRTARSRRRMNVLVDGMGNTIDGDDEDWGPKWEVAVDASEEEFLAPS